MSMNATSHTCDIYMKGGGGGLKLYDIFGISYSICVYDMYNMLATTRTSDGSCTSEMCCTLQHRQPQSYTLYNLK